MGGGGVESELRGRAGTLTALATDSADPEREPDTSPAPGCADRLTSCPCKKAAGWGRGGSGGRGGGCVSLVGFVACRAARHSKLLGHRAACPEKEESVFVRRSPLCDSEVPGEGMGGAAPGSAWPGPPGAGGEEGRGLTEGGDLAGAVRGVREAGGNLPPGGGACPCRA